MAEQPYQSLYRQYRPQRFAEVRGQEHVTLALRNAVRGQRVGHAYLFSGPRGTGKTSTARILAKALNCAALQDGEPCGVCPSCIAITTGSSLDVLELDAASNNGVDAMRDLVARAALGSPGRWKVYIVDEVHMLSTPASNALLKTLEEPPGHVVFVLATTDPQKVLPTIRSRTQPFDFHLLGTEVLSALVRDVSVAAGLGLDETSLERVVRKGNGSARDALSVLDQVAAAGEAADELDVAAAIVDALGGRDVAAVLAAAATAFGLGRDPRRVAVEVIERLRNAFLAVMAPAVLDTGSDAAALEEQARQLGTPAVVRAIEVLGEALVVMRDALDTRVTLEVALVRLAAPEADTSVAALLERVDRLERRLAAGTASGGAPAASPATSGPAAAPRVRPAPPPPTAPEAGPDTPPAAPLPDAPPADAPPADAPPADEQRVEPDASMAPEAGRSRAALGAFRRRAEPAPAPPSQPAPSPPADAPPVAAGAELIGVSGDVPDRDEVTKAWGDSILGRLDPPVRSVFRGGRWVAVEDGTAVFAVPNAYHCQRAEGRSREVAEAMTAHFGVRVRVRVVVDEGAESLLAGAAHDRVLPEPDDVLTAAEVADLEVAEAPPPGVSAEDRLRLAFPGTEEIP